ncbi:NLP/P60 protein [Fictibacillus macauensis ZFHKF-1]|uniref:NLP/P60 protein n=1 Tax=Fictibacillus macauensis ZFHKF-1 TaxID=1196324 RepID=I8UBM4_9BACL|nr:C40 family peptidase [Fictibacillus macauensis]EIT84340.1 NLP/P60 protein [Fictibacillus macauensis ZFHKF-1]
MKKGLIASMLTMSLAVTGLVGGHSVDAKYTYREKAADIGKRYIGVKYKWGGTSPSGFDCSGFVGYSFKKAGKWVPRTTGDLYNRGSSVSKSNLKKGDMVFFHTYKRGASHVGIYLGGKKFVHAASNGVRVDSLTNSYWGPRFLKGKRM